MRNNIFLGRFYGTTTFSTTTLRIMTFSIATLSLKGLFVTLSIRDTQDNGTQHNNTLY